MKFESLVKIADRIDALGFHKEANLLDRIISKRAGVLSAREKFLLAKLAKILLVARKYGSGETIKEDLNIPLVDISTMDLTKQEVITRVQKSIEEIVTRVMRPIYEEDMRGTKYDAKYRKFMNEVAGIGRMLGGVYSARSEEQSVSRSLDSLVDTVSALREMLIWVRSRDISREDRLKQEIGEEIENSLLSMINDLNDIGISIKEHNTKQVQEKLVKFTDSIPQEADPDSPLFKIVYKMYEEKRLRPFKQAVEKVEHEVNDVIGEENQVKFDNLREGLPKTKRSYQLEKDNLQRIRVMKTSFEALAAKINQQQQEFQAKGGKEAEVEVETDQAEWAAGTKRKAYENYNTNDALIKGMSRRYTLPTGGAGYAESATHERCEIIEKEVANLQEWFDSYVKGLTSTTHTFSEYLNLRSNNTNYKPNISQEALKILQENIYAFEQQHLNSIRSREEKYKEQQNQFDEIKEEKDNVRNQVVWGIWYREYITAMANTVVYYLSPTESGGKPFSQAYDNILKAFNGLLNYEL